MGNELILVVDDNEAGRYAKCRMLRQADFQVKEAGSGGEALQIIAAERPDLVCLDVRLPDINGFEVCRRIKTDPLLRTMVLQMSASFVGQDDKAAPGARLKGMLRRFGLPRFAHGIHQLFHFLRRPFVHEQQCIGRVDDNHVGDIDQPYDFVLHCENVIVFRILIEHLRLRSRVNLRRLIA